jgi:hypothetical protein
MALLAENDLEQVMDLPVSLSATKVLREEWIIVASIQLFEPMRFTLRWLQLQLLEVINPFTDGTIIVEPNSDGQCVFPAEDITVINPSYGLAYLALYRGFVAANDPNLQAPQEPPLFVGAVDATAAAIAVRSLDPVVYATAGLYSFVLVNNTTNRDLRLTANGSVRVELVPLEVTT